LSVHDASNLWEAFEQVAAQRTDAAALVFGNNTVSFTKLHQDALHCAGWLANKGIKRNSVVVLQLPKRRETYVLWLSCLHQGAIYVFLDPQNPTYRTQRTLERIRPALLVTMGEALNPFGATEHMSEVENSFWFSEQEKTLSAPVAAQVHGLSPAYIMFTSGSTGEPKGAVIPHQGILSLMRWVRSLIPQPFQQRFSNLNPLHFDNSVFDLYGGLLNGATLVAVETGQLHNPSAWVRRLRDNEVSVVFAVPTLFLTLDRMRLLTPKSLPEVHTFLFGGEGFPIETLKRFYNVFSDKARLVNVYGPTETSCICSSLEVDSIALEDAGNGFVSLGRMHRDFEYMILDENDVPCQPGEQGELWIGGANVGLGYYANPIETNRCFVQDSQQSHYRSTWYRSGDIVREDSSGLVWFLGRVDNQVKVRGHRIELEEIDFVLEAISEVTRAVAVTIEGENGPEIQAVFSAHVTLEHDVMRAHCQLYLPKYMQPTRFVQVEALLQNANGKVDRHATSMVLKTMPNSDEIPSISLRQNL